MKIRICQNCGTHNHMDHWSCRNCGETLSINTIVDLDEDQVKLDSIVGVEPKPKEEKIPEHTETTANPEIQPTEKDSISIWIPIIFITIIVFQFGRTAMADEVLQLGELVGIVGAVLVTISFWYVLNSEWWKRINQRRSERWKRINQRFMITRIAFILFISLILLALACLIISVVYLVSL